jgi:hypothetical protein
VTGERARQIEAAEKIRAPGLFGGVQRPADRRLSGEMHHEIGAQRRDDFVDRLGVEQVAGDRRPARIHGSGRVVQRKQRAPRSRIIRRQQRSEIGADEARATRQ